MDWTKIKTKHFVLSEYTLLERGALATLFALTAHLERMPTEKEMTKEIPKKLLNRVQTHLASTSQDPCTTLAMVLDRVLEDVCEVSRKRGANLERVRKHRDAEICNALQAQRRNAYIREDKSRVDNTNTNTALDECLISFKEFRKKIRKPMTDKAYSLLLTELNKLTDNDGEKIKILEQSILKGWAGVFPLKTSIVVNDKMEARYANYQ